MAEGATPLAIGTPGETVEGVAGAGSVAVLTLTKTGEVTSARRATRAPGKALTKSSALGTSLSASRGLVVAGAPGRTVSGRTGAGSVLLIPTDPAVPAKEITQSTSGVQGSVEKGDRFGHSVSSWWNPFLGRHEIGIGVPGEDVGKVVDGGQVTTLRSTTAGALSTIKSFTQNTSAVHGSVEKVDQFGHAIAVLPRAGKASGWLIGVPYENVGSTVDEGQIQTIGESKNRTWGWNSSEWNEGSNRGYRMGEALAPPRGDRGPVWLAENTIDDRFAGVIRLDGSLDGIGYDYESQYDIGPGIG